MSAPVVIAARRSAYCSRGKGLAHLDAARLAAPVVTDVAAGHHVDEVILGNCRGPGGNPARSATLAAGLGAHTPAVTVDRQCGSGLEAVRSAAALVATGMASTVVAGGVESASTQPFTAHTHLADEPVPFERAPFSPTGWPDPDMGAAADELARRRGITRRACDEWAVQSHARSLAAREAGRTGLEILPIDGVDVDNRPRNLRLGAAERARPAFGADGVTTAFSSSPISDGAAVVLVTTEEHRRELGVPGLALRGWGVHGDDPAIPGWAAIGAAEKALRRVGWQIADVDVVEITEAFASVPLALVDGLGCDPARVCPDGGAIAWGHPWAATPAGLLVHLFTRLVRCGLGTRGLATCGIGGGLGLAVAVEVVS